MLASARLDVIVMPKNVDAVPSDHDVEAFLRNLEESGMITKEGNAGPNGTRVFRGGFARLNVLHAEHPRFVANQQGGFRVFCNGKIVTGPFVRAMTNWRQGGARVLTCPYCEVEHDLASLEFRPPAGFYRFAFEFTDVGTFQIEKSILEILENCVGPYEMVFRRIG